MPIVKCMDLTKVAGDEITFDLINPMGGKPIMGSAVAEGRGRKMSFSQDRLRINQARYPISAGDTMTQQRTPTSCASWPVLWVKLHGPSGRPANPGSPGRCAWFPHEREWAVPLSTDPDFAQIAVNTRSRLLPRTVTSCPRVRVLKPSRPLPAKSRCHHRRDEYGPDRRAAYPVGFHGCTPPR